MTMTLMPVTGSVATPSSESLVRMGAYALSPSVLELIEPGTYLDFPDLVLRLWIAAEERSLPVPLSPWMSTG